MRTTISPARMAVLFALTTIAGCATPTDNPAESYGLAWTSRIHWSNVVNIRDVPGATWNERFRVARQQLGPDGGVVYFPAGEYRLEDHLVLDSGVVLRGQPPQHRFGSGDPNYVLGTRLVFPEYKPVLEGQGTPIDTAFKGIRVADPARSSNVGVVHVDIDGGHVYFGETTKRQEGLSDREYRRRRRYGAGDVHQAGSNRLVLGCILRNAAVATPEVPDLSIGQHPWQRWTRWHRGAIHICTSRNALVAGNRLPESGDRNFNQKGYVLKGRGRNAGKVVIDEGVAFDYDNRSGILVNMYVLGGVGGRDPKGDPNTHPHGFVEGIVIADNYIFSTGRSAIGFSGDGTVCRNNVIRFKKDVRRFTNTGRGLVGGPSTNGNRAMVARGWRWRILNNDYEVHKNLAANSGYYFNDGEGIMHEGHANCTIRDSVLEGNRGNAYLSMYKTAGIDGLVVRNNDIRTPGGISAIFVDADRNWDRHYCRDVVIEDNITAGSGILISGEPASGNVVRNNRHIGDGPASLRNVAGAEVEGNVNYEVFEKRRK